jgi:mannose-6-phosphate isomerase-like protein (cupin superfamily)
MEELKGRGTYQFVSKGWGYEKIYYNGDGYCGKLLFVAKDRRFSWHVHRVKRESFVIAKGQCFVVYGDTDDRDKATTEILKEGDVFHVPPGLRHQIIAITDTYINEYSTRSEDSDSIRLIKGD